MQAAVLVSTFFSIFATASAIAAEPVIQVLSGPAPVIGSTDNGVTRSYSFKVIATGSTTFRLDADNLACGYDLQKSSKLGFLPSAGRFPLRHVDKAAAGDVYTLSFFQNRSARIAKDVCNFSFTVE